MGRNKYTPEQAIKVFHAKFQERYPGTQIFISTQVPEWTGSAIYCQQSQIPPQFSTSMPDVDYSIRYVLDICKDIGTTCAEPVTNGNDAFRLARCVDNNLEILSERLRKAAMDIDSKRLKK